MTREWANNEDAGDAGMMNAADASEFMRCDDCGFEYAECFCGEDPDEYPEDNYTDAEADADTLASAGYGTDEDYGCFDSGDDW
jgi:hypothetical protein